MIRVLGSKILILWVPPKNKRGLIFIPDQHKPASIQGIVKQIGPKVKDIKPGDYVVTPEFNGEILRTLDGDLCIIEEEAITCKLKQENFEIAGLYHLDENGNPFPATIDSAFELVIQEYAERDQILEAVEVSR